MRVARLVPFALLLSTSAAFAQSPASVTAQTSSAATQQPAAPAPPRIAAGPDGFAIESGDGDFRLQIGLLLHADARFDVSDSSGQVADTFVLRRLRPYFKGRFARRFEFYLNPDFANSTLVKCLVGFYRPDAGQIEVDGDQALRDLIGQELKAK